ncbi:MAG: putative ABC transporter ATP-binding protein [Methanomassiliicoccales archaeon PtaU1.Bin124]|nr:MAG: putative ABC transporter ATP-binding protein [Methanomassiliicoccales archaeon PtaU1.Bin124]
MIVASRISKIYSGNGNEVRALDGVDLTIQSGEFVIIIGRSGSGKSTLLSLLGGLSRPTHGSIEIDGNDIWKMNDKDLSKLRGHEIGFVFQFPGLMPTLDVLENVILPSSFVEKREGVGDRAIKLLDTLGIGGKVNSFPHQISGGELKRASIARALINDPSIILADEPTGDLDAETEMEIMEVFRQMNDEGRTIIMVTHNPDLSSFASRVMRMDTGHIRLEAR